MIKLLERIVEEIWPPLIVGLAGAVFAIPALAMLSFALVASGLTTANAC